MKMLRAEKIMDSACFRLKPHWELLQCSGSPFWVKVGHVDLDIDTHTDHLGCGNGPLMRMCKKAEEEKTGMEGVSAIWRRWRRIGSCSLSPLPPFFFLYKLESLYFMHLHHGEVIIIFYASHLSRPFLLVFAVCNFSLCLAFCQCL